MKTLLANFGDIILLLTGGFFGGLASLIFEKNAGFWRGLLLVITGATSAVYLTPLVPDYFSVGDSFYRGISFLVGFLSMRILGGIITLGDRFKKNPIKTIKEIKDGDIN